MTTPMALGLVSNEEAELSVLGAILLSPVAGADEAVEMLSAPDFYNPAHRLVFEAIVSLYDANQPIDPVTVRDRLRSAGELERVGGAPFITDLLAYVPAASNLGYYAEIVQAAALRRRLALAGTSIVEAANAYDRDIAEVLDTSEQALFDAAMGRSGGEPARLSGSLAEALTGFERAQEGELVGLETGYLDVDRMLGGMKPGNLVILAARPSMGKSAWALGAAHHVAKSGYPVVFFSVEMTELELSQRLVCTDAGVDSARAVRGDLNDGDWARLTEAASRLSELPLYVEDTGVANVSTMRARARRIARREGSLGLVIVDYLQLMEGPGENRQQEIAGIARGLKRLARDLEVPVLALSQLNRGVEARENKHPRLADLRDSGSLEQDADVVLFLYREQYYSPGEAEVEGVTDVDIAKHRTGRTGRVTQTFNKALARFDDATRREVPVEPEPGVDR